MVERVVEIAGFMVGQRVVIVVAVVVATLGTRTTFASTLGTRTALTTLGTFATRAALTLLITFGFGNEHAVRQFILTGLRVDLEQLNGDLVTFLDASRLDGF